MREVRGKKALPLRNAYTNNKSEAIKSLIVLVFVLLLSNLIKLRAITWQWKG